MFAGSKEVGKHAGKKQELNQLILNIELMLQAFNIFLHFFIKIAKVLCLAGKYRAIGENGFLYLFLHQLDKIILMAENKDTYSGVGYSKCGAPQYWVGGERCA